MSRAGIESAARCFKPVPRGTPMTKSDQRRGFSVGALCRLKLWIVSAGPASSIDCHGPDCCGDLQTRDTRKARAPDLLPVMAQTDHPHERCVPCFLNEHQAFSIGSGAEGRPARSTSTYSAVPAELRHCGMLAFADNPLPRTITSRRACGIASCASGATTLLATCEPTAEAHRSRRRDGSSACHADGGGGRRPGITRWIGARVRCVSSVAPSHAHAPSKATHH